MQHIFGLPPDSSNRFAPKTPSQYAQVALDMLPIIFGQFLRRVSDIRFIMGGHSSMPFILQRLLATTPKKHHYCALAASAHQISTAVLPGLSIS